MTSMTSKVLSLRMDSELFARLHDHAAKRGMSVQDYVIRTLVRDDFDERFKASVEETERFYGSAPGRSARWSAAERAVRGDAGGAAIRDLPAPAPSAAPRPSAGPSAPTTASYRTVTTPWP